MPEVVLEAGNCPNAGGGCNNWIKTVISTQYQIRIIGCEAIIKQFQEGIHWCNGWALWDFRHEYVTCIRLHTV